MAIIGHPLGDRAWTGLPSIHGHFAARNTKTPEHGSAAELPASRLRLACNGRSTMAGSSLGDGSISTSTSRPAHGNNLLKQLLASLLRSPF